MQEQTGQEAVHAHYQAWLAAVAPDHAALEEQRQAQFASGAPRWSVVCPADHAPNLLATLHALRAQTYPAWELCVAGDADALAAVAKQERVRTSGVRMGETPLCAALRQAYGSHVLLLAAGDRLAPDALYQMSRALLHDKDAVVYADEDAFLAEGERGAPLFKPDFAPETLWSIPYMGRMVGYPRALLTACGAPSSLDTAALYALFLRATARSPAVLHVARVLLTCAQPPPPSPLPAMKQVAQEALKERHIAGYVAAGAYQGSLAVQYGLQGEPRISVVITDTLGFPALRRLLESIETRNAYARCELIVVQDGRQDTASMRYYAALERNKAAQVIECGAGASAMRDHGARAASGDLLLFLDAGLELETPDAFLQMAALAARSGIGAVGAKLVTQNGRIYSAGTVIGLYGWMGALYRGAPEHTQYPTQLAYTDTLRNVSALDGACLMVSHALYRSAGGFDRTFSQIGWDTEFCVRLLRHGQRNVYTPFARFTQYAPQPERPPQGQDRMRCLDALRPILVRGDPYYAPCFDYSVPYPSLCIPPKAPIDLQQ